MSEMVVYLILMILGLCFGSFAGALVWRLRLKQLNQDKKYKIDYDPLELKRLEKLNSQGWLSDRSKCLGCGYILHWYDLIPVFSWLALKGRCRKCRIKIGFSELLVEIMMALFFVLSFVFWPNPLDSLGEIIIFGLWLVIGVGLAVLLIYDFKWFILPDEINFSVIAIGSIIALIKVVSSDQPIETLLSVGGAVLILSGLYLLLYRASKGGWVGFGDVKLGLGLALVLSDWRLALLALLLANLIGSLISLPLLIAKKIKRNSPVPFGPLMIVGYVIAGLFGLPIVDWYMSFII